MIAVQPKKRVAVLISGRGSNMLALAEAARAPDFPGKIVAVFADKADAAGLDAARALGIEARAVARSEFSDKAHHEAAMLDAIEAVRPDVVCLAGYMRLLSADFVARFEGRMINIHPSLLPLFPGLDTHERALAAGVRLHGCTVHFVTLEMDGGPIIAQAAVPVLPGDTPDTLSARLLVEEHKLYPQALTSVLRGEVRMVAGRAEWSENGRT